MCAGVDWLLSGILERFPGINVILSEGGAGWVPYILERSDKVFYDQRLDTNLEIGQKFKGAGAAEPAVRASTCTCAWSTSTSPCARLATSRSTTCSGRPTSPTVMGCGPTTGRHGEGPGRRARRRRREDHGDQSPDGCCTSDGLRPAGRREGRRAVDVRLRAGVGRRPRRLGRGSDQGGAARSPTP